MQTKRQRSGGTMAYTVVVLLVLVGFVGLALDWGYVFWTGQQLQNAADAAALAGARRVHSSQYEARSQAIAIAEENLAARQTVGVQDNPLNEPGGDVVCGVYDRAERAFIPTESSGNAVKVVARRNTGSLRGPLPLFFGPIFGKTTADIARYAIAMSEGGPIPYSLIALNSKDPYSFYLYGNGRLDLGDGSAQVNSSSTQAAVFQGTSLLFQHGECDVVGEYDVKGRPDIEPIDEYQSYVEDPLAHLPPPELTAVDPLRPKITGSGTFAPGYYPGGIDLNSGMNATLEPGVYVLENIGNSTNSAFGVNGSATLRGEGVMIYLKTGSVNVNGTGNIYLTPPPEGVYQGIQFFQARDNTSTALFNGTGMMTGSAGDITEGTGTFYFPNATVKLTGTGDMYVNRMVADKIHIAGDGTKVVTEVYDDGKIGSATVYLVE